MMRVTRQIMTNHRPPNNAIFVYGTLMAPEVVKELVGRLPPRIEMARLWQHSRHPVKGHVYPAVIAAAANNNNKSNRHHAGSTTSSSRIRQYDDDDDDSFYVDGMIWHELTEWEVKAFDFFEDVDYQRSTVKVEILGATSSSTTCTTGEAPTTDTTTLQMEGGVKREEEDDEQDDACPTTQWMEVDAYIWANPLSQLELDKEWSFESFHTQRLDWYLTHTVHPCRSELDRLKENIS